MRISELGNISQIPDVSVSSDTVQQIQPLTVLERARITSEDAGPRFDLNAGVNENLAGLGEGLVEDFKKNWHWLVWGAVLGIGLALLLRRPKTFPVSSIPTYRLKEID